MTRVCAASGCSSSNKVKINDKWDHSNHIPILKFPYIPLGEEKFAQSVNIQAVFLKLAIGEMTS